MNELLERARQQGTPIIEGDQVTFVWEGKTAPDLHGDFTSFGMDGTPPIRLIEYMPGIWTHSMRLPRDAYIEYAYFRDGQVISDPNCRQRTSFTRDFNHYFYMPDGGPTPLIRRRRSVRQGQVTEHTLDNHFWLFGAQRSVYLYQPLTDEPAPLVVVLDGRDYLKRARLTTIVDNLIAEDRIQPIALAMVDHGQQGRFIEYGCNDITVTFIRDHLVPFAREKLNLDDPISGRKRWGILGASMGGTMALYTALREPTLFGHVISQSGVFRARISSTNPVLHDLVRYSPRAPIKVWMECGQYEWLLESNREMCELLKQKAYAISYHEFPGGHNFTRWQNDVWRGLEALYGPSF